MVILTLALAGCYIGNGDVVGYPRVVDGDTLTIGETRVRLWGIDAPEMSAAGGAEARDFLARRIEGQPVRCAPKNRDRYGRTVAMCFLDREDIAAMMVRAGHARDWPRYSGGFYAKRPPG
jgi:endonuclease YncB( thermonuclease family)